MTLYYPAIIISKADYTFIIDQIDDHQTTDIIAYQ